MATLAADASNSAEVPSDIGLPMWSEMFGARASGGAKKKGMVESNRCFCQDDIELTDREMCLKNSTK